MSTFQYTAMDAKGKEQKGRIEAENEEAAAKSLEEQGLFVTSIKAAAVKSSKGGGKAENDKKKEDASEGFNFGFGFGGKIKTKQLTTLTRQLAVLLDAGLPLIRSLRTLQRQAKNPTMEKILNRVAVTVESGSTFSEGLSQYPASFDRLYLNMVRAGEASGKMELILDRLAQFMEKAAKIQGKVKSAMTYPIVVLTVAVGITIGLMVFIVPKFQEVFTDLLEGAELPAITQFVMDASNTLKENIVTILLIIGLIVVGLMMANKTSSGKWMIDFVKYNMPLIGPIIQRSSISKLARTLGTLISSGVPVLSALQIVRDTSGNELVSQAVQQVHDAVKEGEMMAPTFAASKIFPEMVISMIEVGEETGRLPEMLDKIADTYDDEVDNAVSALTSMIEPLLMVFLAVIVGTIVIAMFAPMITMIDKMSA